MSTACISDRKPWISRTVMLRACVHCDELVVQAGKRRSCLPMSQGFKLAWRLRGISMRNERSSGLDKLVGSLLSNLRQNRCICRSRACLLLAWHTELCFMLFSDAVYIARFLQHRSNIKSY